MLHLTKGRQLLMVFSQILFLKLTVFYRSFGGKGGIVISLNL